MSGKVAIVTGGSRGIGAAISRLFVAEGASVMIGDLLEDPGKQLADELGERARYISLDVRDEAAWERVLEVCVATFGPPTTLVNNAGVMVVKSVEQSTVGDFERALSVNLIGPFLGTRTVLGPMRENGGGSIVIMSSTSGYAGMTGMGAYSASKAANAAFAKSAAMELGQYGIRVNVIVPGGVDTPMQRGPQFAEIDLDAVYSRLPLGRIGAAEEIANTALFLCSDESSYASGSQFVIDGGMTAGPQLH